MLFCPSPLYIVVRVDKLKPNLPKLLMPACNKELPAFDIELLRQENKQKLQQLRHNNNQYLSPSPSPVPPDDIDVEIDPDNVVVSGGDRQSYTPSPALSVHGNPPNDHDFNMHTYVSLFVARAQFFVKILLHIYTLLFELILDWLTVLFAFVKSLSVATIKTLNKILCQFCEAQFK